MAKGRGMNSDPPSHRHHEASGEKLDQGKCADEALEAQAGQISLSENDGYSALGQG